MNCRRFLSRSSLLRIGATAAILALVGGPSIAIPPEPDPQMAAIRNRLDKANTQTAQLLNDLKSLDSRIFKLAAEIKGQDTQIASLESRIHKSRAQSSETEARLQTAEVVRNSRARSVYKNGPAMILAGLLNVRSLGDLHKFSVFFQKALEEDEEIIIESRSLIQKLKAETSDLDRLSRTVVKQTQELKKNQDKLKSSRNQRAVSLGKIKQSIVEAMAAEKALLAARAAAAAEKAAAAKASQGPATQVRPSPGPCVPGNPTKDRRLAALLEWYAPAAGSEPFMPTKLSSSDVVFDGTTSWYGPGFEGCATASGATFRSQQMTAASLSLPLGSLLKVTRGGRSVVVVITDRGPYVEGRQLDLSKGAASAIGATGAISVRMEVVLPNEPAPPFP